MRRVIYTISDRCGIELESTFSYTRAILRKEEGCSYTTSIRACPRKLPKEEQKAVPMRSCLVYNFGCLD